MPLFLVSSGDFEVEIQRRSHRQAAFDAIGLLKKTDEEIELGMFTGVSKTTELEKIRYFYTIVLMEENGIKFKRKSDACQ